MSKQTLKGIKLLEIYFKSPLAGPSDDIEEPML